VGAAVVGIVVGGLVKPLPAAYSENSRKYKSVRIARIDICYSQLLSIEC